MTHEESVSFIKNAVKGDQSHYWADLGCGSGTFPKALAALLPAVCPITAVDGEISDWTSMEFILCGPTLRSPAAGRSLQ